MALHSLKRNSSRYHFLPLNFSSYKTVLWIYSIFRNTLKRSPSLHFLMTQCVHSTCKSQLRIFFLRKLLCLNTTTLFLEKVCLLFPLTSEATENVVSSTWGLAHQTRLTERSSSWVSRTSCLNTCVSWSSPNVWLQSPVSLNRGVCNQCVTVIVTDRATQIEVLLGWRWL